MSCLKAGFSVYGSTDFNLKNRSSFRISSSFQTLQFNESNPTEFWGRTLHLLEQKPLTNMNIEAPNSDPFIVETSRKWWEKSLHLNMIEIQSAQQLVDSLLNAETSLVVLHFYSPSCGGCKTLHPKICQVAEMNPNALFLKVNYEQHQAMCCALNVHVLPFFKFYRGSQGRACSFSCTNATMKKFKDALAKHGSDSGLRGPAKGLDESELLALASMGLISTNCRPHHPPSVKNDEMGDFILS